MLCASPLLFNPFQRAGGLPATPSVAFLPGGLKAGDGNPEEGLPKPSCDSTITFASGRAKESNIVIVVLSLYVHAAATVRECVSIIGLSSIGVFVGSTLDLGTAGRLVSAYLPPVKSLD